MRVLIACEYSGIMRDAFIAQGHEAWSCDIIPTERPGPHIVNDALNILDWDWDLMIAHPPCQYLAYSGNAHWNKPGRKEKREAAMCFFMALVNAPIPHIAIENPRGWPCQVYRKPDQTVHPFMFGDAQYKRTCLWLKNLPLLWYGKRDDLFGGSDYVGPPEPVSIDRSGKRRHFVDGSTRKSKDRAKTFPGVAAAMAAQWSITP
jgi:hypothetical protein